MATTTIKASVVDAVLDTVGEGEDPTDLLVDLIDRNGAWDWEGDEHQPRTKVSVLEATAGYWMVGIGRNARTHHGLEMRARRYATHAEAQAAADAWCGA